MSRTAKVSVSTVVQAYVHLENIGLIEARPQSGFYVRPPDRAALPEPRAETDVARDDPMSVATEMLDTCREALARTRHRAAERRVHFARAVSESAAQQPDARSAARPSAHAGECFLPPGHEELRRQIAKRMALAGAPTDPAHVVITSGTMDAITLALRWCASPAIPCWSNRRPTSACCKSIEHLA